MVLAEIWTRDLIHPKDESYQLDHKDKDTEMRSMTVYHVQTNLWRVLCRSSIYLSPFWYLFNPFVVILSLPLPFVSWGKIITLLTLINIIQFAFAVFQIITVLRIWYQTSGCWGITTYVSMAFSKWSDLIGRKNQSIST